MLPANRDLTIKARAGFSLDVVCQDADGAAINLDGYTVESEIRDLAGGAVIPFAAVLDAESGTISLRLTGAQTEVLQNVRLAAWDLFITPQDAERVCLLQGKVLVDAAITGASS